MIFRDNELRRFLDIGPEGYSESEDDSENLKNFLEYLNVFGDGTDISATVMVIFQHRPQKMWSLQ